jgi:iron complex transport system permease protein
VTKEEPTHQGGWTQGVPAPRARWLTPALLLALLAATALALAAGSVSIPPIEVFRALLGHLNDDVTGRILLGTRLPRVFAAGLVGAALALSGLASQTLFRNPLASPSAIGVSNGAALGAVAGALLGARLNSVGYVFSTALSVSGGLVVTALVFMLGRRGRYFGHALLLAGIAIAALCSALTTAMLYLAGERLQSIVFWLLGGLWLATWREVWIVAPVTVVGLAAMVFWSRDLNVALLGERSARDLGLDLPRLQRRLLVLIAILASVAVSVSGVIGFIGLIVPHLARLVTGADHRRLILPTALGGALLLVLADTGARTLASPAEIPVGIFTAATGAPVFLWLLQKRRPAGAP